MSNLFEFVGHIQPSSTLQIIPITFFSFHVKCNSNVKISTGNKTSICNDNDEMSLEKQVSLNNMWW